MDLTSGDLVKVRVGGEERFGQFDRYGRDGLAIVTIGDAGRARVRPMDILENRSEDERQRQGGRS